MKGDKEAWAKVVEQFSGRVSYRERGIPVYGNSALLTVARVDGAAMGDEETKAVLQELVVDTKKALHPAGAVKKVFLVKSKSSKPIEKWEDVVFFGIWVVNFKLPKDLPGLASGSAGSPAAAV